MAKTSHFFPGVAATRARLALLAGAFAIAAAGLVAPARAANVNIDLYAVSGAITAATLPGLPSSVRVLGYTTGATSVANPGGPTLAVTQGDFVTITLHNNLSGLSVPNARTALLLQGQALVPDTTGIAVGETKPYTFTAGQPGTYLYEAGLLPNTQYQAAMGLYGALVVKPPAPASGPASAYADVTGTTANEGTLTAYDVESVLVLSELDPALNGSTNPAAFDMRTFAPKYFLINGKPYPGTDPIVASTSANPTGAGSKVLLRYVNAGVKHHSMAVLGLRQNFIAKDGNLLPTLTRNVAAETLAPGQTADAIATVPATVTTASRFAVYDASLMLHNNGASDFGGMLTFVTAGGATGPATSAVTLAPNPTNGLVKVAVSATLGAATEAEYYIDSTTSGTGTPLATPISTTTLAALASGKHTVYVRGRDNATSPWGAFSSAVLTIDRTGPLTTGLALSPNPSTGALPVLLSGTGSDVASGGSNVTAAEYFIGTPVGDGSGTTMALGGTSDPRGLTATIPASAITPLPNGANTISVHSKDAAGNWGPLATITLNKVVASPPDTTGVSLNPSQTNGSVGVVLSASVASTGSTVAAAEYYIDSTAGTGTAMAAADGAFGSTPEAVTATISPAQLAALAHGAHTVYVRGRDAAGSWGAFTSTVLTLDKQGPITSGLALVANGTGYTLTGTGSDATTGGATVNAAEYFVGSTPAVTTRGTAMSATAGALSATITCPVSLTVPCAGPVNVRSKDALGNWGPFATVVIVTPPITTSVSASPNPNNGALPLSATQRVVRVTATLTSGGSTVGGAEGFLGTVGAPGTGFPFVPADGQWNGGSEVGYADIPLANIAALQSNTVISVRGKDAVGKWGTFATTTLVIDRTPPTVSSITRSGTSPTSATSVTFTVTFSESVTGVTTSNFSLSTTGVTGASVSSVAGSGTTRTVTVNTGTGSGTIRLRKTSNAGITDVAGNRMTVGNFTTGDTYAINKP